MHPAAWLRDLDDLDEIICVLPDGIDLPIRRFQVESYAKRGCTFRPITEEEKRNHEMSFRLWNERHAREEAGK